MDGEAAQPSQDPGTAGDAKAKPTVKVEPCNGSDECFVCSHSVQPQPKHAIAAANIAGGSGVVDEGNRVLKCTRCTGEAYHAAIGGAELRTLCSTCGQETVQQWRPLGLPQGGVAAGQAVAVAVTDNAMDGGTHLTPVEPTASAKPTFLPFTTALPYARFLKLKNKKAWEAFSKSGARPANVPSRPDKVYKHDDWQGYGHWLGTGNVGVKQDQQFLPFKDALLCARSLKLKNQKE